MATNKFLDQFGFTGDPFESTNASDEPNLESYFVPPPYFSSVLGDPANPKSHVVLAPRGGGKTAQRVMIERNSAAQVEFLCVSYDTFDISGRFTINDATWAYHMTQICRLVVTGILLDLEEDSLPVELLNDRQKQLLKYYVRYFLGGASAGEFEVAISAVKNFGDKARDVWTKYGGVAAVLINAAIKRWGFGAITLPADVSETGTLDGDSLRYHFRQLIDIAVRIGFKSVYILIDKIDELALTNRDATSTERFIDPLLSDLATLEEKNVAFKFFLWDQIKDAYFERGARPDRIKIFELEWKIDELSAMLSERLSAYSERRIGSLNDLLCASVTLDLHRLVAYLAFGSPRDMIRVCKSIIDEQTRVTPDHKCIDDEAIWSGIRKFAVERSGELYGDLSQLRKLGGVTVTINHLANDVLRVTVQAARAKIQNWMNTGAMKKIGEIPNPPNRPLHLYGIVDLRLAVAVLTALDVGLILANYALVCPYCGALCISDQGDTICPECSSTFALSNAKSLVQYCTR